MNTKIATYFNNAKSAFSFVFDDGCYGESNQWMYEIQKEIFEKFDDCYNELTDINEREIFVYAFRLGMLIAIEVLSPATD